MAYNPDPTLAAMPTNVRRALNLLASDVGSAKIRARAARVVASYHARVNASVAN